MMLIRKCLFSLGIVALTLSLTTTGFGQVVLGDFEGGNFDGFTDGSDPGILTSVPNTTNATTGTGALSVFNDQSGFAWILQLDNGGLSGENLIDLVLECKKIYADVSWVTSEWSTAPAGTWARWDNVAINSGAGWVQTSDPDMSDDVNPNYPGSWDVDNYGETHTRTICWDLTNVLAGNEQAIIDGGWMQLYWSVNQSSPTGSYWIDNIRFEAKVPEPASLALLAIGGLFTFRRRRR